MSSTYVDFKTVKEAVSMEMVLAHYNVSVRRVNQSHMRGKCPLPTHAASSSNDSFGVHTGKNAWACQSDSCVKARGGKKGGNVLDFTALMEGCSIRDAALKLHDWFAVATAAPSETKSVERQGSELVSERKERSEAAENRPLNRPLQFTLKDIDCAHPYLESRGVSRETATAFGAGFFPGRGSMAGRVVIPIHNSEGKLVAYAGRSIDEGEPKYKLPGGFHKSVELFNLHRALAAAAGAIIVVEGFFDCMKVHQAGYSAVVALMGSTLSNEQEEMLVKNFSRIVLMLDGDEPGREAARAIAARLVNRTFVKVVTLPDGKQPDELSSEELHAILGEI
jgi:DNA primase